MLSAAAPQRLPASPPLPSTPSSSHSPARPPPTLSSTTRCPLPPRKTCRSCSEVSEPHSQCSSIATRAPSSIARCATAADCVKTWLAPRSGASHEPTRANCFSTTHFPANSGRERGWSERSTGSALMPTRRGNTGTVSTSVVRRRILPMCTPRAMKSSASFTLSKS
eukprot:2899613-Pleurochrysis_carterae.AAC.4